MLEESQRRLLTLRPCCIHLTDALVASLLATPFSKNPPVFVPPSFMSRGNQRDIDRARAQKRAEKNGVKAKEKDGLTAAQRKERDAKALQEKVAKKSGS